MTTKCLENLKHHVTYPLSILSLDFQLKKGHSWDMVYTWHLVTNPHWLWRCIYVCTFMMWSVCTMHIFIRILRSWLHLLLEASGVSFWFSIIQFPIFDDLNHTSSLKSLKLVDVWSAVWSQVKTWCSLWLDKLGVLLWESSSSTPQHWFVFLKLSSIFTLVQNASKCHWIIEVTQTVLVPNAKAPLPKVSSCSLETWSAQGHNMGWCHCRWIRNDPRLRDCTVCT